MRGPDERMGAKLIAVIPEKFVPPDHPLRPIRDMVDKALVELSPEFSKMYSHTGRPGIPPEKLLKALLLQAFYSIRSNRLLMEEITYSILFRWFLDLGLDDRVEEVFGWMKTIGTFRKTRYIGTEKVAWHFMLTAAAYNLVRMRNLLSTA